MPNCSVSSKIPVAILGATGTVGQKAIALLQHHPLFEVAELVASPKNHGKTLLEATTWKEERSLAPHLHPLKLKIYQEVTSPFALSALPADEANEVEPYLSQKGHHIFSNASSFRMKEHIPLMIPEINGNHLSWVHQQPTSGKIVTNPNCSTVVLCLGLAPLMQMAPVEHIHVTTLQAISGAGYPGLPSLDILGNSIPYIGQEEEKIQRETKKILQDITDPQSYGVTVNVHRIPVRHGHTITLQVRFKQKVRAKEAIEQYHLWNQHHEGLFVIHPEVDRPQVMLDLNNYDQRIHIGRVYQGDGDSIIRVVALGHNLVRGAAGAALLNMEHAVSELWRA